MNSKVSTSFSLPRVAQSGGGSGHIVYLVESVLDRRDYQRFGLDFMVERGYQVTVLEVADLAMPTVPKDRRHYADFGNVEILQIRSLQELNDTRNVLAKARFIINNCGLTERTVPVYSLLSRIETPYLVSYDNAVPRETMSNSAQEGLSSLAVYVTWRLRQNGVMVSAGQRLRALLPSGSRMKPADFSVFGGRRSVRTVFPVGENTTPIWAHAKDYDLYMEAADKGHETRNVAVFIDEYLPYHRDLAVCGNSPPMGGAEYYSLLCRLFDRVEADLGLRVVIAACPRADYRDKPGLFGDREIGYFQTADLVASSRLVIGHRSTAINYAILFHKPVLLITTRAMLKSHHRPYLNGWARALGRRLEFFDDPARINLTDALEVDPAAYATFIEDYIKTAQSPSAPFWDVVLSAIEADRRVTGMVGTKGGGIGC